MMFVFVRKIYLLIAVQASLFSIHVVPAVKPGTSGSVLSPKHFLGYRYSRLLLLVRVICSWRNCIMCLATVLSSVGVLLSAQAQHMMYPDQRRLLFLPARASVEEGKTVEFDVKKEQIMAHIDKELVVAGGTNM